MRNATSPASWPTPTAAAERGRMSLSVRNAQPGDAAAIRMVAQAAWRDTYAGLLSAATIEAFLERGGRVARASPSRLLAG